MAILHLDVWTNDGPSVTGKRLVRGTAHNPETGQATQVASSDELRALIQTSDDAFTIVVAELTDPI
jgi:hypothetical protein